LLIFCVFSASPALGNIIPRADLTSRLDSNHQGINSYSVVVDLDGYDTSLRIWQHAENWRQEWVSDSADGQEVVAVAVGQGRFDLLSFGFDRSGPPITRIIFENSAWWNKAGLDFDRQSYHFFHGRPVLALGMAVTGNTGPQLWVDNEDMVPLRMVFSENQTGLDLGWLEYKNIGNYRLPHKLIISGPGVKMTCNLEWRGINSRYGENLFSRQYLEQTFSGANLSPPDLVEDFYRVQTGLYK